MLNPFSLFVSENVSIVGIFSKVLLKADLLKPLKLFL